MTTPFPYGAYPNGPDFHSFAQQFENITKLMGEPPLFQDLYVHEAQPLDNWVSNAEWGSGVWNGSVAKDVIPVIGFPCYSIAGGQPSRDDQLAQFAAGTHDNIIRGCLRAYARYSKVHVWRIGWEMNLMNLPWYAGDNPHSWNLWKEAYKRINDILKDEAQKNSVDIKTMWNPGAISWSNAGRADETLWPGAEYVDIVGIDLYNELWPQGGDYKFDWSTGHDVPWHEWVQNPINRWHHWRYAGANKWDHYGNNPGNQSFSLDMAINLAKEHNKPLSLAETGVLNTPPPLGVQDDSEFPQFLSETLDESGVDVHSVIIWDAGDIWNPNADGYWSGDDTKMPNVQRAWVEHFGASGITLPPEKPELPKFKTITGTFTARVKLD